MRSHEPRYFTTEEAAAFLTIGKPMFLALIREYADWLRPEFFGSGKRRVRRWRRKDIRVLDYILSRKGESGQEHSSREKSGR